MPLDEVDAALPQDGEAVGVLDKGGDGLFALAAGSLGNVLDLLLVLHVGGEIADQVAVDLHVVHVQVLEGLEGILFQAKAFQRRARMQLLEPGDDRFCLFHEVQAGLLVDLEDQAVGIDARRLEAFRQPGQKLLVTQAAGGELDEEPRPESFLVAFAQYLDGARDDPAVDEAGEVGFFGRRQKVLRHDELFLVVHHAHQHFVEFPRLAVQADHGLEGEGKAVGLEGRLDLCGARGELFVLFEILDGRVVEAEAVATFLVGQL